MRSRDAKQPALCSHAGVARIAPPEMQERVSTAVLPGGGYFVMGGKRTQDFPFQKTLGNVRWQKGRVILTVGWELQWGDKWQRHGEREMRCASIHIPDLQDARWRGSIVDAETFLEYYFSKNVYLCYDVPSPITLLMFCYVKSSYSWLM